MKLDTLWVEKYRPTIMSGLGPVFQEFKDKLEHIDHDLGSLQHMLFYSTQPGTGKTSLAYAIANDQGLTVNAYNASTKRERNIEFIEEEIIPLATDGFAERMILLDEADRLTAQAQDALKGVIENASCVFVLTCNDLSKVTPYLRSRCVLYEFPVLSEDDVVAHLREIAEEEHMVCEEHTLRAIAQHHRNDLRNCINFLQSMEHMESYEQDQRIRSLRDAGMNCELFLRACFKERDVETSFSYLDSSRARLSIQTIFDYGMKSPASTKAKQALIHASVIAERDLIMGVDPDIALYAFCSSLCLGVYMEKQIKGR